MASPDTRTRLLDAAERLFGERGFPETSLRALTGAAGANLAAVHYHFGSKQKLFQAVVSRVLDPVNAERLSLLDALEASPTAPTVEDVVQAFLSPVLRLGSRRDERSARSLLLLGRMNVTTGHYGAELREVFAEVAARFLPAFARVLPHLPPQTLFWRAHFTIGVLCMTLFDPQRLRVVSDGLCDPGDTNEALVQMVAFVTAGLQAAPPAATPEATQ